MRHSCASLLLQSGTDLKTVSTALGHSSVAITADLYSHIAPVVLRDAANRLNDLVEKAPNPPDLFRVVPSREAVCGGPGRIRTYAQPVMSRPLYR